MCLHVFRQVVDTLPGLERLTLQGLGEPLLAPELEAMVEHACARGIRVGFNTNATLLTRPRAERLVEAGLAWLHISLDGARAETYESIRDGADFDLVRRNVRGLVEVIERRGAELPRLSLVAVAMRRNLAEIPELVRIAADWRIGRLWVQNLSHTFSDTDPAGAYRPIREFAAEEALWAHAEEASEVFARASALAEDLGVELRLPRLQEPETRTRRAGEPGCDWPWRSAYVNRTGRVQACCMLMGADRGVLGDAASEGFAQVWHGELYRRFREGLLGDAPPDVCEGCSAYRGLF